MNELVHKGEEHPSRGNSTCKGPVAGAMWSGKNLLKPKE